MTFRTYFKDAIGLAAIIGMTAAVYALPAKADTFDCGTLGTMAENIMTYRQDNAALSTVMAVANETGAQMIASGTPEDQVNAITDLFKSLTLAAYQMSRFTTPAMQDQAIRNFRNQVETECYTAIQ